MPTRGGTETDRQDAERLRQQAAQVESQMRYVLAFARRHGITGAEAQRFLARQRASLRRQQAWEAQIQALAREYPHQIAHCRRWHVLTQIPMRLPCCGRTLLKETP